MPSRNAAAAAAATGAGAWPSRAAAATSTAPAGSRRSSAASAAAEAGSSQCASSSQSTSGAPAASARQQVAQGPVHAVAVGGLGPGQRAQRGQEAGQGARVLQAEPLDAPVAQHGVQRLGQRCVGEVDLGLRGPRARHPAAARVGARRELGQQPRLADPGLALDHQRTPPPSRTRPSAPASAASSRSRPTRGGASTPAIVHQGIDEYHR